MRKIGSKITWLNWLIAIIASISFGIIAMVAMGGSLNRPLSQYIWNAGYSVSLGLPLFANGFLFNWFADRYIDWIKKPLESVFLALALHLVYSSFVIFTVNWFWFIVILNQPWENFWASNSATIISEYIIFVVVASIIYAVNFFKAWYYQVEQNEKVKREALSLKYRVLQDQVNPHFLFNSLNVLETLIDLDVKKSKDFTRKLSSFYRDVLLFKDEELISLKEELEFIRKYIYLQQIRFGEALEVDIIANEKVKGNVIPLSLQALVENAIKHNEISIAKPLKIVIAITDDRKLIVENNLQLKKQVEEGSKTGLKNLAGRYEFLTGKKVEITDNDRFFRVSLPLIQMEQS